MLTTEQIQDMCANVRYFCGVFAADSIPKISRTPATMIVNTDPGHESGEHWIVLHLTGHDHLDYFDPLGFPPFVPEIVLFLSRFHSVRFNNRSMQDVASTHCGDYCVCYVKCAASGLDLLTFISRFQSTALGGAENNKRLLHCVNELSR